MSIAYYWSSAKPLEREMMTFMLSDDEYVWFERSSFLLGGTKLVNRSLYYATWGNSFLIAGDANEYAVSDWTFAQDELVDKLEEREDTLSAAVTSSEVLEAVTRFERWVLNGKIKGQEPHRDMQDAVAIHYAPVEL